MATEIKVPTLGESVTEATVARWLKQPGDTVAMDDPLVELETDKVTLEVNAPAAGTLTEVVAAEGANVGVGAVLGVIGEGAANGRSRPRRSRCGCGETGGCARAAPRKAGGRRRRQQWRGRYPRALRPRGPQSRCRDRRRCDQSRADRQGRPRHQDRYRGRRFGEAGTGACCARAARPLWVRAKSACA